MRARSKLPNSAKRNYGNYGYSTEVAHYEISYLERRQRESQHRHQVECDRKEKLEFMMKIFSDIFDVEFPVISATIKEKLFQRWISHGCNKDVAHANIQIENMLVEFGNGLALQRWQETYKAFRLNEVAKAI